MSIKERTFHDQIAYRDKINDIIFIHGFGGDRDKTWGKFPKYLSEAESLEDWNIHSFGYKSGLYPSIYNIWTGIPSITNLADLLRTYLKTNFKNKNISLIAHSMGGLVVQKAIVDDTEILKQIRHLFLFGTPSIGLKKASPFKFWNRQVKDLSFDSNFILDLDKKRKDIFARPKFIFRTVGGDADEFVPRYSSLDPFDIEYRCMVPGNHLGIVKPSNKDSLSVQLVVKATEYNVEHKGPWNIETLVSEQSNHLEIINAYEKNVSQLDEVKLVQLALALESLGRQGDAVNYLEKYHKGNTDAIGALAGRFKRIWIHHGHREAGEKALKLYSSAYKKAVKKGNHSQSSYLGINMASIYFVLEKDLDKARRISNDVLQHCQDVEIKDHWCIAAKAEAYLILGKPEKAIELYAQYIKMVELDPNLREMESTFQQAYYLADLLYPPQADGKDKVADLLDSLFRPKD